MKVRILDGRGHTDLDVSVEEAIREIELVMNQHPRALLVEQKPGEEAVRIDTPSDLRDYPDEATVWVIPQFVGGKDARS